VSNGNTYFWRVQSVGPGGNSVYSGCFSFSVNSAAPVRASGTIQANLNGCQVKTASDRCAATVTWTTQGASWAQVWMQDAYKPETKLFEAPSGQELVSGLEPVPQSYIFRLYTYSSGTRGDLLSSSNVSIPAPPSLNQDAAVLSSENPSDPSATVNAGARLRKSWTLQNAGSSAWDSRYSLQYVSGNAGGPRNPITVSGQVPPGSSYTFSADFVAPATPGSYREDWAFIAPSGNRILVGTSASVSAAFRVADASSSGDQAGFVSETIGDGTVFKPGESFSKAWLVRNTGSSTWRDCLLVFVSRPNSGQSSVNLTTSGLASVPVAATEPDKTSELTVPMRAPTAGGAYRSYWQLQNRSGTAFGPQLYASIIVKAVDDSPLTLLPTHNYQPADSVLKMTLAVKDSQDRIATSASCASTLRDATGSEKASVALVYQQQQQVWIASPRIDPPLAAGRYTVTYDCTDGARKGTTTVSLFVETGLTVEGKALDASTGKGLDGVTVAVGGQTTTTGALGDYSLTGLDAANSKTINATKAGYTSSSAALDVQSNTKHLIRDIRMQKATVTGKPVITGVATRQTGLFLAGIPVLPEYSVSVNWNGAPGTVDFYLNGSRVASTEGTQEGARARIPLDFSLLRMHLLRVIATNREGQVSAPYDKNLYATPLPQAFGPWKSLLTIQQDGDDLVYALNFSKKITDKVLDLPILGKFGGELTASAHFDYRLSDGSYHAAFGAGSSYEAKWVGLKAFAPREFQPGRVRFFVGKTEIAGNVLIEASGLATPTRPITISEVKGHASVEADISAGKYGLLDIWPGLTNTASSIPFFNKFVDAVSVDVYVVVGLDGDAVLAVVPEFGLKQLQLAGTIGLKLERRLPVGDCCGVVLQLEGTTTLTLQYPGDLFQSVRLNADASAEFYVKVFWIDFDKTLGKHWCWSYPSGNCPDTFSGGTVSSSQPVLRPLRRDYLKTGNSVFVANEASAKGGGQGQRLAGRVLSSASPPVTSSVTPLVQNIFPYGTSSLASNGSELMLLYVADSGASHSTQFTDINWMRFDGTSWTAPLPIAADPRGEFSPRVAYDGSGDAIAVWERIKDANLSTNDLPQFASQLEIVWSRFDRSTRAWTTPAALTDNNYLDHAPRVAGPLANGDILLVWTVNTSNLLIGEGPVGAATNDQVFWTEWHPSTHSWSAPQKLVGDLPYRLSQTLAGAGTTAIYAWSQDMDGDLSTRNDREILYMPFDGQRWSSLRRLTSDQQADDNVRAAISGAGAIYLAWQRDDDLVMDRNLQSAPVVVRAGSQTVDFADYSLTIGPKGNLAINWQGQSTRGADAFVRFYDPNANAWSADLPLTDSEAVEYALAPAWDSAGNLVVAYDQASRQSDGSSRVDLAILKRGLTLDLAMLPGDFTVDGDQFLPGEKVRLTATVRNTGELPVRDVIVSFYSVNASTGAQLIGRQTVPGWLPGGAKATVAIDWEMPDSASNVQLRATVESGADSDQTNNSQTISISGTDLLVRLLSAEAEADGSARIVCSVRNEGVPSAPTASVVIRRTGNTTPLDTAALPALAPGRVAEIGLTLPAAAVPPDGAWFTIEVDPSGTISEPHGNNSTQVFLRSVAPEAAAAPVFSPGSGSYPRGQAIRITTTTEGALIHYTTNGEDPTEVDPVLPSGATVLIDQNLTLKAASWKSGMLPSTVSAGTYVLLPDTASTASPSFTSAGVTNGASFVAGLTPGSIATIFGTGIAKAASGIVQADRVPLPTQLAGSSVTIGGIPAPLFAVVNLNGQEQINLQVPLEISGRSTVEIVVTCGPLSSLPVTVNILDAHPGIFAAGNSGVILHGADNSLITAGNPASKGEVVVIYATGLGTVDSPPRTGMAASASPLSRVINPPVVVIGGAEADVQFAGLAPNFVGLYQVNARVSQAAAAGEVEVIIRAGGQASRPVKTFVR